MKNRRQFLKNTALSGLAFGAAPKLLKSNPDAIINCEKTTLDYYGEGPFYTEQPPLLVDNKLAKESEPGKRLIITGRVLDLSCDKYLPNTKIDMWHADHIGAYDNDGYNLRGFVLSNDQGFYLFKTILPGKYLNGSKYRPSHIHFKITPPGFSELTTQLYFEGDEDIPDDKSASITEGQFDARHRIIRLEENSDGVLEGNWDIIINGDGLTVGTSELHINRGMLYELSPNPFKTELVIKYGLFKEAKATLFVFDVEGKTVAKLSEQTLVAEKYEAIWRPESHIPNGHYYVSLKVNDIQVHYLKVLLNR